MSGQRPGVWEVMGVLLYREKEEDIPVFHTFIGPYVWEIGGMSVYEV